MSATTPAPLPRTLRTHRAGAVCFWAGILGAASGIFLALVPPAVPPLQASYPLTPAAFIVIQGWFVVQHLGLIAGLIGVRISGAVGDQRRGLAIALAGMALLTAMELLAIGVAWSPMPSRGTEWLDAGYGIACTVSGIGLIATGVAVARVRAWRGWRRWLPLALGVYVFVPMFPAMFGGFLAARLGITGWMLLFAALGWAESERWSAHATSLSRA